MLSAKWQLFSLCLNVLTFAWKGHAYIVDVLPFPKVPVKKKKNPDCPGTGFIVPGDGGQLAAWQFSPVPCTSIHMPRQSSDISQRRAASTAVLQVLFPPTIVTDPSCSGRDPIRIISASTWRRWKSRSRKDAVVVRKTSQKNIWRNKYIPQWIVVSIRWGRDSIPALIQIMALPRPGAKPLCLVYWRTYASLGLN